jgi:capsular exopolysaccharide synthesis family protein
MFSQQRVKSYEDLLTSGRLANMVADAGAGLTTVEIQSRLSAKAKAGSVMLDVTVTDTDAARVGRIAEVLSAEFVKLVAALETRPGNQQPAVKVELVSGPIGAPTTVSPDPARNMALGGLLGFVIGLGAAALRELLDNTISAAGTLSDLVNAPVLATIPYDRSVKRGSLILAAVEATGRAEAYRYLRTNLRFVNMERSIRALVITSALRGEGKSTTAANLAIMSAEAGWRTLLIDADLRRPWLAESFGLEGAVGLTDVLIGELSVADAAQQWGGRDLWILPTGVTPPNPSEVLGSRQMDTLLAQVRAAFDIVIIDTPPLLQVTDAALVAGHADGVVLVARSGRTKNGQARAAAASLTNVGARLVGCVLNMHHAKGDAGYYFYSQTSEPRSGKRRRGRQRPAVTAVQSPPLVPAAETANARHAR